MPELSEKDFINEGYSKNPYPLWIWFFLLLLFIAAVWGVSGWYHAKIGNIFQSSPFLQVTNRELSLYLWQNPENMRVHAREKSGYLPGFQYVDAVTMDLAAADQYAEAPPELLFLYHTWKRLISGEFIQRPIPKQQFVRFLRDVPEWTPRYWPAAPERYTQLTSRLPEMGDSDLASLSLEELPQDVRMAFQGWKNFFIEGEQIEKVHPTIQQMQAFLLKEPHFARNYWRNIVADTAPNYLKELLNSKEENKELESDQLAPFLKVAFYNYIKAEK